MAIYPPSTPKVTEQIPSGAQLLTGAAAIRRGVQRMLAMQDMASLPEFPLGNGRRADLVVISRDGDISIIEIKSCRADFTADRKWRDYLDYCDTCSFAVDADFPLDLLPSETGIIRADAYGAEIVRQAEPHRLTAARRKAMLIAIARTSASRHHALLDPTFTIG